MVKVASEKMIRYVVDGVIGARIGKLYENWAYYRIANMSPDSCAVVSCLTFIMIILEAVSTEMDKRPLNEKDRQLLTACEGATVEYLIGQAKESHYVQVVWKMAERINMSDAFYNDLMDSFMERREAIITAVLSDDLISQIPESRLTFEECFKKNFGLSNEVFSFMASNSGRRNCRRRYAEPGMSLGWFLPAPRQSLGSADNAREARKYRPVEST